MISTLRQIGAWLIYRLIRAYWWIRRPVILGVRVLVSKGDRVLLIKHSYRKGWFLPGGTPEVGESLHETARREVREEAGAAIRGLTLLGIYSSLGGAESDHVAVFVSELEDGKSEGSGRTAEVTGVRWTPATNPPQAAAGQTRLILRDWHRGRSLIYRIVNEMLHPDVRRS
jgi:8-oxo-dGTP pyrophosphatase MutT (NUDIX family)